MSQTDRPVRRHPFLRPRPRRLLAYALLAFPAVWLWSASAELSATQTALLAAITRREPIAAWPGLSAAQLQALHAEADDYFANYQRYHQRDGLTADVLFSGRDRAAIEKLEGIGDSATWTGHYLAALAFRYAVTRDETTLAQINRVLEAFEILTQVSGKEGYLARFAGPANDAAFRRYYAVYGAGADPERPGLGTWAFRGTGRYSDRVWLGYASGDVYVSVNLGLATTYRLVPVARVRRRIQRLVELILDCLARDEWRIVDGHGRKSPTQLTPSAIASLLRTGATVHPAKYQKRYEEKARLVLAAPVPGLCQYCSYFPNNVEFGTRYVLLTLETDPARRAVYQEQLGAMWEQCCDHLNAYFAALYASGTRDSSNLVVRATIQGGLAEFPAAPRWDAPTDLGGRTDLEFMTVDGRKWARYALPIARRVPSDFIWQRSPCNLKGGGAAPLEFPGIDLLLPYWIARQCGVIPAPGQAERE